MTATATAREKELLSQPLFASLEVGNCLIEHVGSDTASARPFCNNPSAGRDKQGLRNARHAVVDCDSTYVALCDNCWPGSTELVEERGRRLFGIAEHDGDDAGAIFCMAISELDEFRMLDATSHAPRGEEVHNDPVAPLVLQVIERATKCLRVDLRSDVANDLEVHRRASLRVAEREQQKEQSQDDRNNERADQCSSVRPRRWCWDIAHA